MIDGINALLQVLPKVRRHLDTQSQRTSTCKTHRVICYFGVPGGAQGAVDSAAELVAFQKVALPFPLPFPRPVTALSPCCHRVFTAFSLPLRCSVDRRRRSARPKSSRTQTTPCIIAPA